MRNDIFIYATKNKSRHARNSELNGSETRKEELKKKKV